MATTPPTPPVPPSGGFGQPTVDAAQSLGAGFKAMGERIVGTGAYAGKGIVNGTVAGAHVAEKGIMGPLKAAGKVMQRFPGVSAALLAATAVVAVLGWRSKHNSDEHIAQLEALRDQNAFNEQKMAIMEAAQSMPAPQMEAAHDGVPGFAQRELERRQTAQQTGGPQHG